MPYSVNWQRSEGHHLLSYGKIYSKLGNAKKAAMLKADDLMVKRCTIFDIVKNKTVFDAIAKKYNIESDYNNLIKD